MSDTRGSDAATKLCRAISQLGTQEGIGAKRLTEILVEDRVPEREARRAIQCALERGTLELGPALKLYPRAKAAA
jgi:hypothetical protein